MKIFWEIEPESLIEIFEQFKIIGMPKKITNKFEQNKLCLSKGGFIHEIPSHVQEKIKDVQKNYNLYVYHVIYNETPFGILYTFLYVPKKFSPGERNNQHKDLKQNMSMAYVYNTDEPYFSEFGLITFETLDQTLKRIF